MSSRSALYEDHEPVVLKPLEVVVIGGRLDRALKKLRRKMAQEGVLKEMKRRRRAVKPSERRRRKRADARKRARKRVRLQERVSRSMA